MPNPPDRDSIGAKVRDARQGGGHSLRGFAAVLGVSPATLSHIENDKATLSVARLQTIADALGISPGDLLDGPDLFRDNDSDAQNALLAQSTEDGSAGARWRVYESNRFPPILEAALAEFLEVGYHGTSMRRISARCGVSVPGMYGHYPSKQTILVTILSETMSDLEWRAAAAIADGTDPVSRFCLAVENLALFHTHHRDIGFISVSEMRALEPPNRNAIAARRHYQQQVISRQVREGADSGSFDVVDPDEAARAVVSMCTALPNWWRPDGPLSAAQVADEYVRFGLRVVGYRPPV